MRGMIDAACVAGGIAALTLLGFAYEGRAHAQSTAAGQDDEAARQHFRLGQAHYENGTFAAAAAEFEEAYRLSRRPQLLYNVFVAHRDAGQLEEATQALRSYLELVPDPENGAMLRARLASMERLVAGQRDSASEDEAAATDATGAGLDADAIGDAAPESGGTSDTTRSAVRSTDTASARPDATRATSGSPASGGGGMSPVGFIVGGAGLALTLVGAITGGVALSTQDSLDARCPNRACPAGEGLESERDTGAALAIATDVLIITGVVTLATGVVLLFVLGDDAPDESPVALGCGAAGCDAVLRGRF